MVFDVAITFQGMGGRRVNGLAVVDERVSQKDVVGIPRGGCRLVKLFSVTLLVVERVTVGTLTKSEGERQGFTGSPTSPGVATKLDNSSTLRLGRGLWW